MIIASQHELTRSILAWFYRGHVKPLSRYGVIGRTEHLVQGVDVWINTPRRPWEQWVTGSREIPGSFR
jgi:glucan phosphorylase